MSISTSKPVQVKKPAILFQIPIQESSSNDSMTFLKSPNLIQEILSDITSLGYVGEEDNKLLVYLAATSRKLPNPISILIRSRSSTGKSYLMDKVCELMPEEDVNQWSSLTPKALYYMPMNGLKHKLIVLDEKAGVQKADYPIRSLQSSGRLSIAVPIKNNATGEIETKNIIKEGPICYMDACTDTRTHPENANRCFEIFLDESEDQTRKILELQRFSKTLKGWQTENSLDQIKKKHQEAQRLLKPVRVIIPFIDLIDFPVHWIRARRDHSRFISLIECIAFLHQFQREIKFLDRINRIDRIKGEFTLEADKNPDNLVNPVQKNSFSYIEATIEDYSIAYKLASSVLFNTFQEMEKPVHEFYEQLIHMAEIQSQKQELEAEEYWFTRKEVRAYVKMEDYLIKRYMKRLKDLEYFEVKGGRNGSRDYYRILKHSGTDPVKQFLITPEELKKKWNAVQSVISPKEKKSFHHGVHGGHGDVGALLACGHSSSNPVNLVNPVQNNFNRNKAGKTGFAGDNV